MGRKQVEANNLAVELLQHVLHAEEMPRRFGHLLAAQVQQPVVHPVMDEPLAGGTLALRELVFVMREDEVLAATVEVERLAQVLGRHGGALDMPPGPARTPRALPRRLARLGRLPEREVERIFFFLTD